MDCKCLPVFHIINNVLELNWPEIFVNLCDRHSLDLTEWTPGQGLNSAEWLFHQRLSITLGRLCPVASNAVDRKSHLPFTWATLSPPLKRNPRYDYWKKGFGKGRGHQDGPYCMRSVPLFEDAEDMTPLLCVTPLGIASCALGPGAWYLWFKPLGMF